MSENTKKNNRNKNAKYNLIAVQRIAEKYSVTEYYVRQAVKKACQSETCDKIRKDYNALCKQLESVLKKA